MDGTRSVPTTSKSGSGHLVRFVRMIAGSAAGDVHAALLGFDDDRKDGLPEAGVRVVVGMSAD